MTKQEYLQQLAHQLAKLPQHERDAIVEYYTEYLDDAEDEQTAMQKLGTPREVALSAMANQAVQAVDENTGMRKGAAALWVVAIATLSPFALVLSLCLMVVFILIIMVVVLLMVVFLAGGVFIVGTGFFALTQDFISALFFFGAGLFMFGVGLLVLNAVWRLGGRMLAWAAKRLHNKKIKKEAVA